ncbi:acyl-CoA carboxylase subunit epsilon [Streptomyces sp. NBC_01618]|uniref:acyl-CoA carboxylase subunit epsilon n=1 Tax=Streptomyces sp. NBC_01618 TaxID=2975900 RepID=UPI0038687404|nr:acyl-CoA carboxylase subunit epsilon [Streptomyces sp. NBC_01618]
MTSTVAEHILRVEKGHARSEELAAITVVLLARVTARTGGGTDSHQTPSRAGWQRLERMGAFRVPHSWQG